MITLSKLHRSSGFDKLDVEIIRRGEDGYYLAPARGGKVLPSIRQPMPVGHSRVPVLGEARVTGRKSRLRKGALSSRWIRDLTLLFSLSVIFVAGAWLLAS